MKLVPNKQKNFLETLKTTEEILSKLQQEAYLKTASKEISKQLNKVKK